jgi:hypothetical protein
MMRFAPQTNTDARGRVDHCSMMTQRFAVGWFLTMELPARRGAARAMPMLPRMLAPREMDMLRFDVLLGRSSSDCSVLVNISNSTAMSFMIGW